MAGIGRLVGDDNSRLGMRRDVLRKRCPGAGVPLPHSPTADDDRVVTTPLGLFLNDDGRIAGRLDEDGSMPSFKCPTGTLRLLGVNRPVVPRVDWGAAR